jgi:LCP family protein required for cell wall assembly
MRNAKKTLMIILLIAVFSFAAAGGFMLYETRYLNVRNISKTDKDLGIKSDDAVAEKAKKRDVLNIALFGVDTGRQQMEAAHSDTIMVLSIDRDNKEVKLSSIMRDSYVSVEGHGNTKITHAYSYGGPQLAIKTLNENFNLDIRDFVTIDFAGLASVINMLGGIEVNVKKSEIAQVNKYAVEVAKINNEKFRPVKKPGLQLLMGAEAVSYARIRHVGNGDFDRVERQQVVLTKILEKFKKQNPLKYPAIMAKAFKYVETSMDKTYTAELGLNVLSYGITPSSLEFVRFPVDGYYKGEIVDKLYCLTYDLDKAKDQIHKFIYDGEKPAVKTAEKDDKQTSIN